MTLKNNRAPLLSNIKLYALFHHHMWIHTGVTVRKRLSWVMTSVTLTFDLWPWPFAWTSLFLLVITPENCGMMRWQEHSEKGVTDRQTDGRTDGRTDGQPDRKRCSESCLVAAKNKQTIHLLTRIRDQSVIHRFNGVFAICWHLSGITQRTISYTIEHGLVKAYTYIYIYSYFIVIFNM